MSRFKTVVCGVDASPESFEAARQARLLAGPGAALWGVSVWDPSLAVHAGIHAGQVAGEMLAEARSSAEAVADAIPDLQPMVVRGRGVAGLTAAASNLEADLIAIGSHGSSRMAGIVLGSVATGLVHHAPCSVLVAREAESTPADKVIVHADDGSADAQDAALAAAAIAKELRAGVVNLHVGSDLEAADSFGPGFSELIANEGVDTSLRREAGSAPRQIVAVATELQAELVVIGTRGLTGVMALGSVSERTAHRAPCSVLLCRQASHPQLTRI